MSAAPRGSGARTPTFQDLVQEDLKTGNFRPIYVLAGEDALRIEGVVDRIKRDALGEGAVAFNFHSLAGDQVDIGRVLQQALSLPMFAGRQVILVKQADRLLADATAQERFEQYARRPVPETILILSAAKVDKRKKWVKVCQEAGYLFDFTPPVGEALVQWVLKAAQRENLPLGQEEARILCDLVGSDLMSLKSEIDKLALLAEDRGRMPEREEIRRIIMDQAELQGYEITAQLEPGRAGEVLRTWFRLAEWGKSAYEISPLLTSRIRKSVLLDHGRRQGLPDQEIGSLSGGNPWSFRYLEPMIRAMGPGGLRRALVTALACDRQLKGSPLKPEIIIEKTVLELCRQDPADIPPGA